jgi:excisionase family DNA binding protein
MDIERRAYSVEGFCDAFGIGRSTFYRLQQDGCGPAVMRVGRRTLISAEAVDKWRRQREEDAAHPASPAARPAA